MFGKWHVFSPQPGRFRVSAGRWLSPASESPLGAAPGGGEYFDYITFDAAARRVYLSHGTEVKVLDADTDKVLGDISGLRRDHGIAIVPELGRGFISDGDAGEVVVFDLKTLKITGHIKTDKDSDSILYDAASKRIFCFNGEPNSVSVISIAMDRQSRRLFIGARNPAVFVVMDADTGKIIGPSFPIGARVDTTVFDPKTSIAARSTGDGTIHVFHEDSANKITAVETVKTEYGAKTMALDPKTHNLLVDTSDFSTTSASNGKQANPRPTAKPGTFRLLVYGR